MLLQFRLQWVFAPGCYNFIMPSSFWVPFFCFLVFKSANHLPNYCYLLLHSQPIYNLTISVDTVLQEALSLIL